jgi:hypothetical protein
MLAALLAAGGCAKTKDAGLGTPEDGGMLGADATGAPADAPAIACDGPTCKHQPIGSACATADDCESASCADGVCCEIACSGACVTCNQAGSAGRCLPIAAGQTDAHGVCPTEAVVSCGFTGRCNGQGGCARYPAGTTCQPSSCMGGSMVPPAACDGHGTCLAGPAIACDPYQCGDAACRDRCTADQDCVTPATCMAGSCGKRGLGQACQIADDCKSGFCADGVCCSEACAGQCRFCALASALGRCIDVPADTPDPRVARGVTDPTLICVAQAPGSCGTNGSCDGRGGCQFFARGLPCKDESCDSTTNVHTGQFSCDGQGQCVPPPSGSCAPFKCSGNRCAGSCTTSADCASPATCQNGSCGKKPTGQECALAADCASGNCQQGICCSTTCTGACVSCAQPGTLGLCVAVPAGAADPSGSCRDQGAASCGTDGVCSGSPSCRKYAPGTVCAAARCTGGTVTATSTCDGQGACLAGVSRPCDPYVCNAAVADCYNSCTDGGQCAAGNLCQSGRCGKKGLAAPCTQASDCTSGFCVDGVCCDVACAASCASCALPGSVGTCAPVPAGQSDSDGSCASVCSADGTSSQDRRCDGAGSCVASGSPVACGAYVCRGGRCLASCTGSADCVAGDTCTAMACLPPMKKANGQGCLAGAECQSNSCVDKTCCSTVSCATCQSCANAAGTCAPVAPGTSCGPTSCSADGHGTVTPTCGAAGSCAPAAPVSCGNYICSGGACKTSCATDADCVVGHCRGFKCH